ncbi:MAG: acylphosphatase [Dehalococcoidales bacterium]|nr:acylphosphatase [Dehalococcoidales bacterium]
MNSPAALHAIVKGHVQGVYFRAFTERHAVTLGLTGYVRNIPSGEVEVIAEGERIKLEELVKQLRQGPPHSIVAEVDTDWLEPTGKFGNFHIQYF